MLACLSLAVLASPRAVTLRLPVNETTDTARYSPGLLSAEELTELCPYFDNMPVDPFLRGGTRTRLYGKHRVQRLSDPAPRTAEYKTNVFIQTGEYNDLVRRGELAVVRKYERLPPGFMSTRAVQKIVDQCADDMLAMGAAPDTPYEFGMHAIRITAPGNPTPEGTHRDGYAYVMSTVIDRQGIEGGHSGVHTGKFDHSLLELPMEPGDALVVNDKAVYHSVSNITTAPGHNIGHRDVVVITARPWRGGDMGEHDSEVALLQLEGTTEAPNPEAGETMKGAYDARDEPTDPAPAAAPQRPHATRVPQRPPKTGDARALGLKMLDRLLGL